MGHSPLSDLHKHREDCFLQREAQVFRSYDVLQSLSHFQVVDGRPKTLVLSIPLRHSKYSTEINIHSLCGVGERNKFQWSLRSSSKLDVVPRGWVVRKPDDASESIETIPH